MSLDSRVQPPPVPVQELSLAAELPRAIEPLKAEATDPILTVLQCYGFRITQAGDIVVLRRPLV
jgi:hypothetical protein